MKLDELITELHLRGANAVVQRYKTLYEEEDAKIAKDIKNAKETHSSLPNNYWHKRHELLGKYLLAEKLAQSFLLETSQENSNNA